MNQKTKLTKWWGEFPLNSDNVSYWQLDTLSLWVQSFKNELRIAYESQCHTPEKKSQINIPCDEFDLLSKSEVQRFGLSQHSHKIKISPMLADRPVVVHPEKPFKILPHEKIKIYISTPLWVRLQLSQPKKALTDIPIIRPSDTWFGPNTLEGELCYASHISIKIHKENIELLPYSSLTEVSIDNQASKALLLESLKIPVMFLSLFFHEKTNKIWTESINLIREEGEKIGPVQVTTDPPDFLETCEKIQDARMKPDVHLLARAFKNLF